MKTVSRDNCPIHRATNEMGDQWSLLILREFFLEGTRRFSDLEEQLGLSPNTLSTRLKKLEQAGVVVREIYSTNPPRSEYKLTDKGRALAPVMNAIYDWGMTHTPDLT
ncbi:MAG: helix-turn-helix transcriptional regulator [Rhodobacteraceae bacterium]|nr:helix-turn-helix transcriptional regulator [Paracoccaceae bacterium]